MKTKKIILIAVAVVVVAGAGIWFFAGSPAKHKVTYATANVSKAIFQIRSLLPEPSNR